MVLYLQGKLYMLLVKITDFGLNKDYRGGRYLKHQISGYAKER